MFNQNDEKKLDWMYKGPTSTVDREEYLLGRSVDKTLDQINEEEKQKQQNIIAPPKNRVEHECIPPSIRDFNKVVQAEQVDLSAKLQEDPLVAIKKREEETRRQFLQNPVQLKKLQKALKAQEAKKTKKKKKKAKESDLDAKLTEKLLGVKKKKLSKEERDLDIILMHKYEEFKHKLTEQDLEDILNGKYTDSDDGSDEKSKTQKKKSKKKKKKRESSSEDDEKQQKSKQNSRDKRKDSDSISEEDRKKIKNNHRYESDDSDSDSQSKHKRKNYGLVNSQGTKIPLSRKHNIDKKDDKKNTITKAPEPPKFNRNRPKRLTDEEKERLRREMMQDAAVRDKERERNVRKYRAAEEKEKKEQDYDPEFAHKQFIRSAQSSSVESRIKSNLNNIQRSSRDMDKNFSRRH